MLVLEAYVRSRPCVASRAGDGGSGGGGRRAGGSPGLQEVPSPQPSGSGSSSSSDPEEEPSELRARRRARAGGSAGWHPVASSSGSGPDEELSGGEGFAPGDLTTDEDDVEEESREGEDTSRSTDGSSGPTRQTHGPTRIGVPQPHPIASYPPPMCVAGPSVALACKGPLNARLATGVGLSFFLSLPGPRSGGEGARAASEKGF